MTTPASALIRASIAALPEGFRGRWAVSRGGEDVVPADDAGRFYVVAHANLAAPFVALFGPDVATALADLLDAIEAWRESQEALTGREFLRAGRVLLVARDVQAAITKGGQP